MSEIGLPMSSVSKSANSALCVSTKSAHFSNTCARALGASRAQRPSTHAARHDATARSMSAAWPRAMCASTAPVAGLMQSNVSPANASTYCPSMNKPVAI